MQLPRSRELAAITELAEAGSTNDELATLVAAGDQPEYSVVITTNQTAGRGRLGRDWVAPPGKAMAASVLLRPTLPAGEPLDPRHFGWFPLIAGAAMTMTVASLVDGRARMKWPNDVLVDERKISGLLAELVPPGDTLIVGVGLNLTQVRGELPGPGATSLALCGVNLGGDALVDLALSGYLIRLRGLVTAFLQLGADAGASGILDQVSELCSTLGREVRVELPGGDRIVGTATEIDGYGRLVVRRSSDGRVQAVAAGDVTHLRYE